jgi:hemoglobin
MRIVTLSLAAMLIAVSAQAEEATAVGPTRVFAAFGGKAGIAKIVDDGIDRVLADDRIKARFAEANIPRLKGLLTAQFCILLGGNCTYRGRSMREAHAEMGLRNAEFNALAEDFQLAMDAAGIAFSDQNVLLKQLAPMQHDIVTK